MHKVLQRDILAAEGLSGECAVNAFRVCLFAGAAASLSLLQIPPARAANETVLYSFRRQQNCADGSYPVAGLLNVNGTLYGTTFNGGAYGWGAVFVLNPKTGAERVLYSFRAPQTLLTPTLV